MKRNLSFGRAACRGAAVLILGLCLFPATADAISRYTSTSMPCASIKAKIGNEGAVILKWTSKRTGNTLYDRFVRNVGYCSLGEVLDGKSVPASNGSCLVYRCDRPIPKRDDDWFFWR